MTSKAPKKSLAPPRYRLRGRNFYLEIKNKHLDIELRQLIQDVRGRVETFLDAKIHFWVTDDPAILNIQKTKHKLPKSIAPAVAQNFKYGRMKIISGRCLKSWCKAFKKTGLPLATSDSSLKHQLRQLRSPFIKIEDMQGKYQSLIKERVTWLQPIARPGCTGSPFEPPDGALSDSMPLAGPVVQEEDNFANAGQEVEKGHPKVKKPPPTYTYCELCKLPCPDIQTHVQNNVHQRNLKNSALWKVIDEEVANGPDPSSMLPVSDVAPVIRRQSSRLSGRNCENVFGPQADCSASGFPKSPQEKRQVTRSMLKSGLIDDYKDSAIALDEQNKQTL